MVDFPVAILPVRARRSIVPPVRLFWDGEWEGKGRWGGATTISGKGGEFRVELRWKKWIRRGRRGKEKLHYPDVDSPEAVVGSGSET